jgi:3-methylcrotonyl-CoA carboxylase beta subunit
MNAFISKLDTEHSSFHANAAAMQALIDAMRLKLAEVALGGGEENLARHKKRGKLTARERIEKLLDKQSPFLELSPLAAYQVYEEKVTAAGLVAGIGRIHGHWTVVIANDATVKGGTYYPLTVKKHLRALQIALENQLPCVYLVDSGGAHLPSQAEVFPDREHFGRIFYYQAQLSARCIPKIAVVMGSCTAGGAYVPAMSDEVIMVKDQATIFLAGPPLVKAATGEVVTEQALGGADLHCRQSGVADYYADNDKHALKLARECFRHLNLPVDFAPTRFKEPVYPSAELNGILPRDTRISVDMREIIARIVDGSEFHEFKALYGKTVICTFAEIGGHPIGIIANNGILFSESALKATHFIELCCSRQIPILFLQNITGFMVGSNAERQGIAKDGAKMVHAVANAAVPKLTVIIGGSFGAGNYGMCGRAYDPRFLWSWPTAKIGVMGGVQAARVLADVKASKMKKNDQIWDEADRLAFEQNISAQYEAQASSLYASAHLWDDGIIFPEDTRTTLIHALNIVHQAPSEETHFGVFRM